MPKKKKPLKTEIPVSTLDEANCLHVLEHIVMQRITEILGTYQLVLRDATMPEEVFQEVYRSKMHCHELIGKVSIISELTEKVQSVENLHLASYAVQPFFMALTEQMNALIGDKIPGKICFLLRENSEPEAVFDARRVSMVVYHLVSNALRHGRTSNKTVELRCFVKQHKMRIAVRDFGGGFAMPRNEMGVGLPFCRKVALDMRGDFRVHNYKTGVSAVLTVPQLRSVFCQKEPFCFDDTLLLECFGDLL